MWVLVRGLSHVMETITSLCLVISAVSFNPLCVRSRSGVQAQLTSSQLLWWLFLFDLFPSTLPIHHQTLHCHFTTILGQRRLQDGPSPSFQTRKKHLFVAGGTANWTGLWIATSWAGADRWQCLLAATPEGWVVRALMSSVVVVGL